MGQDWGRDGADGEKVGVRGRIWDRMREDSGDEIDFIIVYT